jgi:hypothetical protein
MNLGGLIFGVLGAIFLIVLIVNGVYSILHFIEYLRRNK